MALPQQVIDRLSKEPPKTPGWSYGLLLFSGGVFFIAGVVYLGLAYGYTPYVQGQVDTLNNQVDTLAKSISSDDQSKLVSYYSEITNVKAVLQNHVIFSRFMTWLEQHTDQNVYFSTLTFNSGDQVRMTGLAPAESDVNQQLAIFENAPEVTKAQISTVAIQSQSNLWGFDLSLTLDPQAVLRMAASP